MYKIIQKETIVPNINLLKVHAPNVAKKCKAGQFVVLMPDEKGERIPISIADWNSNEGSVTIVFIEVGTTTRKLAQLSAGDSIPTFCGPLGSYTKIEKYGTVICAGGCYGNAAIYPIARALKEAGNKVITVIEARSRFMIFWEDLLKIVSDELILITRDGSYGYTGHITDGIEIINNREEVDKVFGIGCAYMMMLLSEATRKSGIKTVVNLNPIMVDGTGMCGVCRVVVNGKVKFACVDGPDFDGHEVDWNELISRRKAYIYEEIKSLRNWECEVYP